MTWMLHLLALLTSAWLTVGAVLWVLLGGAVGEAAVLLLAALVLVALAAVLSVETRR